MDVFSQRPVASSARVTRVSGVNGGAYFEGNRPGVRVWVPRRSPPLASQVNPAAPHSLPTTAKTCPIYPPSPSPIAQRPCLDPRCCDGDGSISHPQCHRTLSPSNYRACHHQPCLHPTISPPHTHGTRHHLPHLHPTTSPRTPTVLATITPAASSPAAVVCRW